MSIKDEIKKQVDKAYSDFEDDESGMCLSQFFEKALLDRHNKSVEMCADRVHRDVGPNDNRFDWNQRLAHEIRAFKEKP